jgi:hypothetical protein
MASTIKVDKIAQSSGTPEFTIPTADGTAKSALITDGSGVLSFATGTPSNTNFLRGDGTWQNITTNPLSLTGSTNTWIPTITAADALTGTANFTYDGTTLGVKNSGTASDIKVYCETANSHYTSIKSAAHAAYTGGSWTMTLPGTDGAANEFLQTDGAGATTWAAAGASASNAPAFLATLSASVAITDAVNTKAACNTELLDTDGLYDNATYRFTVDAASVGWYWISGTCEVAFGTANALYLRVMIYRNGSEYMDRYNNMNSNPATTYGLTCDGIIDLTTVGDYVELWLRADDSSGSPQLNGNSTSPYYTYFNGYKLAGVT